ncbi:MAG: CBS domain-containing protein, partial [Candidatus Pacearchaeota archaeon]|nr:CBS domain-containing protein [Candidatus Pacearchaeota archaeon]
MKKSRFLEKLFAKSTGNGQGDYKNLDREKKDMIRGVVELSESIVKEIMVPRIDVVFVHIDTPIDELLAKVAESRHSRVPMYSKTIDNVIGILHVKDLVQYLIKGKDTINIQEIIREPFFVPETKKLNSLLKEFKKRKVHIAVVVDEYGGTSGVVCLEDIIEEIVGDIQDEFDNETEDIL